ncbi:uncharacterized protein METZ01_LOCUS398671, partial [marine metagenome]
MNDVNFIPPAGKDIPILDMTPLSTGGNIGNLAREMNEACKQTAFFYVKNHGIAQSTIDSVMEASKLFFGQPIKTRMLSIKDQFHRGYLPFGTTQYPGQGPDLKDSYDVGIDLPLGDPDVIADLPLHGPNQ